MLSAIMIGSSIKPKKIRDDLDDDNDDGDDANEEEKLRTQQDKQA